MEVLIRTQVAQVFYLMWLFIFVKILLFFNYLISLNFDNQLNRLKNSKCFLQKTVIHRWAISTKKILFVVFFDIRKE